MPVRNVKGSLDRETLNGIGQNYFSKNKSLSKIIKKGDAPFIRKLNEKRASEIKKAKTDSQKKKIKDSLAKEKKGYEKNANEARKELNELKKGIKGLLNRGVGAIFTNAGNIIWKDLLVEKDRKSMLKDLSIMSDANVSREYLEKKIKNYENSAKKFNTAVKRMRFRKHKPYKIIDETIAGGRKVEYLFDYYDAEGEFNLFDTMEANVKRAINNTRWRHPNAMFNIRLSTSKGDIMKKSKGSDGRVRYVDSRAFSLPRFEKYTIDDVLDIFEDKFERTMDTYEEDAEDIEFFEFKTIAISYLIPPNKISGSGGHKTKTQADSQWFITDSISKTNCFYRSISSIRLMKDLNNNEDLNYVRKVLIDEPIMMNHLINDRAKALKKRLASKTRKTTTEDDIQNWVNSVGTHPRTKCCVKIYDNVFGLRKVIEPETPVVGKMKVYEVWCINHHFIPLVRWYDLNNIRSICKERSDIDEEKKKEKDEEDICCVIDKKIAREIVNEEDFIGWMEIKYDDFIELDTEDPREKKELAKRKSFYKYLFCSDKSKVRTQLITKNNKIATYDIEATGNGNDDTFKCYRISLVWNVLDELGNRINMDTTNAGMKVKSFGGTDCITKFFDYIYKNRSEFSAFTFYAHNAGKYDLILLMNEYILFNSVKWKIKDGSLTNLNGAYLNLELEAVEGDETDTPSIRFRDSLRLLPMGLEKLGIDFNVPHKKQGKDLGIKFDEINIENCFGDKKLGDNPLSSLDFKIELSQRVYCDYDTICLLECLNQFNEDIYEAMNLDMTGCLTGASLSKQNFFKNYYSRADIPIYHLSSEFDAFCRDGYMGGRCEAHYIGEHKADLFYFDFTSLYPDVGRRRMPYGRPERVNKERIARWNERIKTGKRLPLIIGMMKFNIRTKDFTKLPLHGIKREGKLLFPHFKEWTELTLWANEFNYGNTLDMYEYELIDAIHFGEQQQIHRGERETFWDDGILKGFFTEAVDKKALAKEQKKPALAQSYKIVANSGYGFWGLNANGDDGEGRDGMMIMSNDDISFWELLARREVNNVGVNGDYTLIRTMKPMDVKDFNVSIAAAIASEARIKIHKFMNAILKNGGKLLYCDTDSCITDLKLCDYPEMMEEFCWDGTGKELGSMKNEAEEKLEKYFKNKYGKKELPIHMEKQKEVDGGEYCFDKGIIAGCKQYCLYKKVYDGGFIEAEASKGCKRSLDYSDFHHLLYGSKMEEQKKYEEEIKKRKSDDGVEWEAPEGFRLYERQIQFRSGLNEHIKEGCGTDVKIINLDKSMRINYLKGMVAGVIGSDGRRQSGKVEPLNI